MSKQIKYGKIGIRTQNGITHTDIVLSVILNHNNREVALFTINGTKYIATLFSSAK